MAINKLPSGLRDCFSFKICDDCIEYGEKQVYFLRIHPKNMSILSFDEKLTEIKNFQSFLDASASQFSIFVTDKTENLDDISRYYKRQMELRPEYEFVIKPIIDKISSIEQTSASVQRAFYLVLRAKDRREYEIFSKQLSGRLVFKLAVKEELILVLRNFILREYTPFSLYVFEDAVKKHYEDNLKKANRNRRAEEYPLRENREDNLAALNKLSVTVKTQEKEEEDDNAEHPTAVQSTGNEAGGLWPHT